MTGGPGAAWPAYRARPVWWSGVAMAVAVLVVVLSPLVQNPEHYRDQDWLLALHYLHERGARFGVDVMFTYGPWGFLWGGYWPATFGTCCGVWAVLAAVMGWAFAALLTGRRADWGDVPAAAAVLWLSLLLQGTHAENADARLLLLPFLLALCGLTGRRGAADPLVLVLAATCGFVGTVKFTYLIVGGMAIGAITLDGALVWRWRAWPLAAFAGAFFAAWLAAGQRLHDLPAYVRSSVEVAGGYAGALGYTTDTPNLELIAFAAAVLVAPALVATSRMPPRRRAVLTATLAAMNLVAMRASMVRDDWQHAAIGSMLMATLAVLVPVALWPLLRPWQRWLAVGCVLASPLVRQAGRVGGEGGPAYYAPEVTRQQAADFAGQLLGLSRGEPTRSAVAWQRLLVRSHAAPVPLLAGTVDLIPMRTNALLVHGLDYDPRPTLQSYAAYTPLLAGANARKYAGPSAPAHVLFGVDALPSHLPSMEENLLWVELLARYRPSDAIGYPDLVPRLRPRTPHWTPIGQADGTVGRSIAVPRTHGGLLWAKVRVRPTAFGRLAALLYKPPTITMKVGLPAGERSYELIPANAAEGFLLGPLVTDDATFARLLDRPAVTADLASLMPNGLTLSAPDWWLARWSVDASVHVDFEELSFSDAAPATRPASVP